MKLFHSLNPVALSVGLGLGTLGLAMASGCSSSSSPAAAGDSGPAPSGGDAGAGLVPPTSSGSKTTSTTATNFALHTLQLGDTDRMGTTNANAWAAYGFNLDGKATTTTSTDVCTLQTGAPMSVQIDGNGLTAGGCVSESDCEGVDNSFGENILPLVLTVAGSNLDSTLNTSINSGAFTVMLDIVGLTDSPTQTNTGITGQLFAGAKFAGMPTWTTADNWPVVGGALLKGGTVASGSTIQFPDSYVVNGTWVSGAPIATLTLSLSIGGEMLQLNVHQATLTFDHTMPGHAANGTIAGVITTSELVSSLMAIAGHISTSLCNGGTFQSIAQQIEQASDIMSDGSNGPGKECDAISIGLGFTADQIAVPTMVAPATAPQPNPCSPADAGATD